jgi:uncharacterized protein DUF2510
MTTPQRPGWYPAPDGTATEQWWNGAAWSDSKRGLGGAALPGLPGYQAAPPAGGMPAVPRPDPYTPQPPPTGSPVMLQPLGGAVRATATNSTPLIALIFGIVGIFFFAPLGLVGIIMGATVLRRPGSTKAERSMAFIGIFAGIAALIWGAIQVIFFVVAITGLPS